LEKQSLFYYNRTHKPAVKTEHFADLGNVLYMNQSMDPLDALTSANILYKLVYKQDGNMAIVKVSTGKELWSTSIKDTTNLKPGKVVMSHDGNVIMYDADSKIYWTSSSNNKGEAPYRMELQNDGSIAVFDAKNTVLWTTKN
jgi:outer membrane protein assembly factor BamB